MTREDEKRLSKMARKSLEEAERNRFLKCGVSEKNLGLICCWSRRCIESRTPYVRINTWGDYYGLEVEVTIDCDPPESLRQLILAALSSVAKARIEEEPGRWNVDCSRNNPELVAAQVYDLLCEWMAGESTAAAIPRRCRTLFERATTTEKVES